MNRSPSDLAEPFQSAPGFPGEGDRVQPGGGASSAPGDIVDQVRMALQENFASDMERIDPRLGAWVSERFKEGFYLDEVRRALNSRVKQVRREKGQ